MVLNHNNRKRTKIVVFLSGDTQGHITMSGDRQEKIFFFRRFKEDDPELRVFEGMVRVSRILFLSFKP